MRILLLSLLLQPLFIFAQTKPILFPASVDSLLTLSDSLINHSQLEESVVIMEHAESLIIKNLGAQSTQYGRFCLQKAKIQKKKEEYQKAEEWYKKALHTYEVTVGKYHPEYALALSKTADFYYYTLHEYETAEPLYLTALPILKNAPNTYFKDYINTTANLGELYWNLANLKLAENKLLEAKRLWESQYGKDNKAYSGIIIVLANVYGDDNQAEKAEVLYHEAKDIGERLFGKNHVYYSTPLHNLATLAMAEKQYEKAERMFLETKSIEENTIGTENLDYANTISNLAEIYQIQGKYQAAEKYFLQAISIQKKFEEKNNLYLMDRIYGLGDLYLEIGQPLTSLKYYEEGNKLQQSALSNAASHLSEKELQAYTDYFESVQAKIYSYAQLHPEFTKLAYDNILFYKGFLLDEAKRINHLAQADSMGIDLYQQLKKNQNLLSVQYTRSSSEQEDVAVLEEKSNTLEKKLRRRIAGFNKTTKSIKWQDIQAQLEASEVAIELIHYNYYKPKATDSVMYAALMIRKGDVEPLFIPLFEEAQIKQLLTLKAPNQVAYAENIYAYQTPKKENITTLSCLYDLIWQPLQPYLNQTETIYYAPSGLFHRLNLQAIETPKKHPLADDYHFVRFNSIREFIPTDTIFNKRGDQAILMGGIQYEMNEEMVAQLSNKFDTPLIAGRGNSIAPIKTINFSIIDTNLRGNNWDYLKWTEVEVDAINFLLEDVRITPIVKKAYHANEQYFKSIGKTEASPRILHIATHGYFFPDTIGQATQYRSMDTASIYQISYHPMIRSGLILAGGNYAWKNGRAYQTGLEDGILTAYEIAQMNLSHTELVVLSACQTGLGDIEGNEGVYGLQRAFKLAGAKYLLMSLWQVPDFQTQELMTAFYYHWLEGRKSIPLAFKAAQTEIRKKYPNPFYWAGFVLVE